MIPEKYSSGIMAESCWFIEMKEYLKMKKNGFSDSELKTEIATNNLFGAPNEYRAKRIYGYISRRASSLDDKAIELFFNSDLSTQKIMNLVCIMRTNRLLFEFVNEVYREKIILGADVIEPVDTRVFFNNKAVQSDAIAKLTDSTKKKVTSSIMTILSDSNLLTEQNKKRIITPPIIDILLEKYLISNNEEDIIKAMTGAY